MKKLLAVLLLGITFLVGPSAARAELITGLTTNNQIFFFDSATPGTTFGFTAVTGLGGSTLVGIDYRPATPGVLVGVSQSGTGGFVYEIDTVTGAATQINTIPVLSGTAFGVDFNPVPNALRIVSNTGQNLRITAGGTGVVNVDTPLNPTPNSVVGAAYSNNFAGATVTTLYVIDSGSDTLLTQGGPDGVPSPNLGQLFPVGPLGFDTNNFVGFDISGATGTAFASLTPQLGIFFSGLHTINLNTGQATFVGNIDSGGFPVQGISVSNAVPEPSSVALLGLGAVGLVGYAYRRRRLAR